MILRQSVNGLKVTEKYIMAETETLWESPRKKEQKRLLAARAVFESMMQAADEGEFTREEAIKALENKV